MMYWKSIEETHTVLLEPEAQRNLDLSLQTHVSKLKVRPGPSLALSSIQQDEKENADPKKEREYKYYSMNLVLF